MYVGSAVRLPAGRITSQGSALSSQLPRAQVPLLLRAKPGSQEGLQVVLGTAIDQTSTPPRATCICQCMAHGGGIVLVRH